MDNPYRQHETTFMHNKQSWQMHLTVAAVIQHKHKYLLVTDKTSLGLKLNQPAGHVDNNESITQAIVREVKEETGLDFTPTHIIGIYLAKLTTTDTYLRVCFTGSVKGNMEQPAPHKNDDGVIAANWYTLRQIEQKYSQLRSCLVKKCLNDFLLKKYYPLDILSNYEDMTSKTFDHL